MPGDHLYEYAVIRLVPDVEREEFINVGVILSSIKGKFLQTKIKVDESKLNAFAQNPDLDLYACHLASFEKICLAGEDGGPIAQMDLASRFRWLTAVRSSVIQTSRPHAGLTDDLPGTLDRLFGIYVGEWD
ncbi:hypothetical protein P872_12410 [Rhodonellum psychrophilum GCM71 = DSM 17998]|uniref:DUF3037 domain-containing protein n=2 Tax=Rhodonellum TaxID=336827 RepID=U5BVN3_9BACT|nr:MULTISPECIES: DUF3037 domain-containing protein [Rhodonellum]ERM80661.1 hypothetical protein P872_12410 [Rhodonellum psychrophilum GCM71 = DSM 17998]SDZ32784.1 Protein of unknown function [Rhodonellum ikkaensis]